MSQMNVVQHPSVKDKTYWRASESSRRKDERDFAKRKAIELKTENLRDDVISLIKNSKLSDKEIQARCGPCPATLDAWRERRVRQPRLSTVVAALDAIGKTLVIK